MWISKKANYAVIMVIVEMEKEISVKDYWHLTDHNKKYSIN